MTSTETRDAVIDLKWATGDTYRFRLALGQLRELQERLKSGPAAILRRLTNEQWNVDDIRETVRLGLIGGGMAPLEAVKLIERYVDSRPWLENVMVAQAILIVALSGVPDEAPGKRVAGEGHGGSDTDDDGRFAFAGIYTGGALLGLSPQQIEGMSLWQWLAVINGWNEAHTVKDPNKVDPPTAEEFYDRVDRLADPPSSRPRPFQITQGR